MVPQTLSLSIFVDRMHLKNPKLEDGEGLSSTTMLLHYGLPQNTYHGSPRLSLSDDKQTIGPDLDVWMKLKRCRWKDWSGRRNFETPKALTSPRNEEDELSHWFVWRPASVTPAIRKVFLRPQAIDAYFRSGSCSSES